jgi:hypothetical protein
MQQRPLRPKTIEFEAAPGWRDAPQTLSTLPVPAHGDPPRPHANLRAGAVTFPDVGELSFRVAEDADWREFIPYSVMGLIGGWAILGALSWLF